MLTSDFDYHLHQDLIAQTPVEPRDSSRILVLDRASGLLQHKHFHQIYQYLQPGIHDSFDIFSLGADGREGGSGSDADLGTWQVE